MQAQANWLIMAVFFTMVLSVGIVMSLMPLILGPRVAKANATKKMAYESGMPPIGAGPAALHGALLRDRHALRRVRY